jgi:hypothetical protein
MAPSIGAFHTLFIFRREGCRAQAVIPGSAMARATLLQREETHRALTRGVLELLEGICNARKIHPNKSPIKSFAKKIFLKKQSFHLLPSNPFYVQSIFKPSFSSLVPTIFP